MSFARQRNSVTLGRIRLAMDRISGAFPMHGSLLARLHLIEDESAGTMAIGLRGQLILRVAPTFVEGLRMDELCGVLLHECNHVLFGHVIHVPAPGENRTARVIAEEITANEWISGPLPGKPVLLSGYAGLPENEDTQTRYDRLVTDGSLVAVDTLDDHGSWQEVQNNPGLGELAVSLAVGSAWDNLCPEERSGVSMETRRLVGQRCGTGTPGIEGEIGDGVSSVPWQRVLRRYAGKVTKVRPVFGRPPRRFPELVGVLPGRGRFRSAPIVMAVIDTSGSLSTTQLAEISAELARLAKTHKVTVVECDVKIHRVYPYTAPIISVKGRGGTDLRPPLAAEFLVLHKPDLVLYFTDGCGPAPDKPPRIPVMWVLTAAGKEPCAWGAKVRMGVATDA